jgi:lipopolysaccharide/colanic/teichoic acid biosynthesis glycosyltransferase
MAGIRILGLPQQLEAIIDEFVVHGIRTDRVIIGADVTTLPNDAMEQIKQVCARHDIRLDSIDQLAGMPQLSMTLQQEGVSAASDAVANFQLSRYFAFRRFSDPLAALALIILLSPVLLMAAALALIDVGTPVLFWQQRIGRRGRPFLLYKLRTLKAPYDYRGRLIPDRSQLSFIGRLLRQTRCDELPQLFNVLVGDMALIGPRPLLPEDQPINPAMRLIARPGISGWAQVNGGKFLTPQQKDQYDEFYIRNASVWFDLRILYRTMQVLFRIGYQSDHQVAAADRVGFGKNEAKSSAIKNRAVRPAAMVHSPSLDPDISPALRFSDRIAHKPNPLI